MSDPDDFREPRGYQVDVDETSDAGPERPVGSVTWIALVVGVLLTVLLMRLGIWFFFLPIIIPFGFRGSLLGRRSSRRRFVRLDSGTLSLVTRTFAGGRTAASIDVSGGVFVSVSETGVRFAGVSEAAVRVVGADGAFDILLGHVADARRLKQRLVEMLAEASVRIADGGTPLRGGVMHRTTEDGAEFLWEGRRARPWGRRRTTRLRIDRDGWALRVNSGPWLRSSTGGPGVPQLRLTTVEHADPLESGITTRELLLEILWDDEVVARIGRELSEPELRFIVSRSPSEQPRRLIAR